jgi:hypothetical protein
MKTKKLLLNTGLSIFIWLATNLLSAIIFLSARLGGFNFELLNCDWCASEMYLIILAGLVVSFPANFLLVPSLYFLSSFSAKRDRIIFATSSILILSLIVIFFFFRAFEIPSGNRTNIFLFLLPYLFSAQICFLLFVRKKILTDSKQEMTTSFNSTFNKH